MEIWKDIENYEGLYQVSSLGNIKSLERVITKIMYGNKIGKYTRKEKILKPGYLRGYKHVVLCKEGNTKNFKVHRLVANAFIYNYENKPQINHKNRIKDDNNVLNLEWVTEYENTFHSKNHSLVGITKSSSKWRVRYKQKHYGYFESLEDAIKKLEEVKFNDKN